MNERSAFIINEESHEKIVKKNEEEKRKELKRKKNNARQRAFYQRQKDLKKNKEIIKKIKKTVPKSNAERQRKFRQHNKEKKSYMDMQYQVNRPQMVKMPFLLHTSPGVQTVKTETVAETVGSGNEFLKSNMPLIFVHTNAQSQEQILQSANAMSQESINVDSFQIPMSTIKSELQTESEEPIQHPTVAIPFEKIYVNPSGTTISKIESEPETQSETETKFRDEESSLEVTSTSLLEPPINESTNCRTCFKEIKSCDISSSIEINNQMRQMLLACTNIHLLINKAFPGRMCGDCYQELQISYEFKRKCDWSQQQFEDKLYLQAKEKQATKEPFIKVYKPIDGDEDDSQNIFIHENPDTVKNVDKEICPVGTYFYGYKCNLCDKVCESKKKLHIHKNAHLEKPTYLCSYCGQMLHGKSALTIHENNHQKETFYCGICSKTFVNPIVFERHKQFHANPNPYLCAICGIQFPFKYLLQRHVEKHSSSRKKKFKCDFVSCEKAYLTKSSLHHHKKTHKGERNHECSICHKKFYEKNMLMTHLVVHSNEKPHACKVCSFQTKHKNSLNTHMKLVHKLIKSA